MRRRASCIGVKSELSGLRCTVPVMVPGRDLIKYNWTIRDIMSPELLIVMLCRVMWWKRLNLSRWNFSTIRMLWIRWLGGCSPLLGCMFRRLSWRIWRWIIGNSFLKFNAFFFNAVKKIWIVTRKIIFDTFFFLFSGLPFARKTTNH